MIWQKELFKEFNFNESAETWIDVINGIKLPADYLEFISKFNGGEGFIGEAYVIMYRIEELEEINKDYEIERYFKNVFIFGSDGGGMHLAYNSDLTMYYAIDSCNIDDDDTNRFFKAPSLERFFQEMQELDVM